MSELQDKVRKENYAIYTLHGMLGHLVHLHGNIHPSYIIELNQVLHAGIAEIKVRQRNRKPRKNPMDPNKDEKVIP